MNKKQEEIDIIIKNWLEKMVWDRIDDHLQDIHYTIEDVIAKKYERQLSKLNIQKIIEKFTYKDLINRLDKNKGYRGENNRLNTIIEKSLKEWISKFLARELKIYWNDSNLFKEENLEVKDEILKNVKQNNRFVKFITKFFN